MKKKRFVILIILLGVVVFMGAILTKKDHRSSLLRVAFPKKYKSSDYEPTRISFDFEYIFLENVFSPLVEVSKNGSIESGVAESFEWIGDELKLTIRKNLRSASGKKISSDDVLFSLKRLLVLSGNTHGNFKDLVCPNVDVKSVHDDCPGLRKDSEAMYILAKGKKSFLVPMLAAIDFAIIPRSSVDPKTLKIINFKETSGPYYVESDDGAGNILLKLNPYHYFASDDIAKEIVLVPATPKDNTASTELLLKDEVDLITTVDAIDADRLMAFAQKHRELDLHTTAKIKSIIMFFTEKGQKDFSTSERHAIAHQVRLAFKDIYKGVVGFEQRKEFFPHLAEGALTDEQRADLEKILSENYSLPSKTIRIGIMNGDIMNEWIKPIQKRITNSEFFKESNMPNFRQYKNHQEVPHAVIISTDTGFMEDISLISYSLNAGMLGLSKKEISTWLADYMAIDDKSVRIQKLKELHFSALAKATSVPLMAAPYVALARKPWKIDLSELFANNQLWRIKHQ